jgi:hypothetical protein
MSTLTKIQIIEETIDYYKKHNRSVLNNNKCCYLDKNGNICAHSRCIDPSYRMKFATEFATENAAFVIQQYGDIIHLERYRGHSIEFWSDIQQLHDHKINWQPSTISGEINELTSEGKLFVDDLLNKYKE